MRRWADGLICSACFSKACETYGRCAGCDVERLTPGLGANGELLCTDCAGGLGDFTCTRCNREGWMHFAGVCSRCVLVERLAAVLDDGSGQIRPELVPLFDSVRAMEQPRAGILWLAKPHVAPILGALARGEVPLTHEGVSTLSPWRSVIYVRDLLVGCGVLPEVDRFLFLFEQWLPGWLEQVEDLEHRRVLHRFATWHVLRQLRAAAAEGPIGHYRNQNARSQMRRAAAFLDALAARGRGLLACTQADVDRWYAGKNRASQQDVRPFLRWAMERRHMPRLQLPPVVNGQRRPISQKQRIALVARIHSDPDMSLDDRVLALLILLYAQPLNRIVRLTVDDIIRDDAQVLLRLGDPPVPVPEPFADTFRRYVSSRPNMTTATNPDSRLLFPGRRAGQAIHPTSLRLRLHHLGIPNLDGRTRAIRDLLLRAPAPVVARMLGYDDNHSEKLAAQAGTTWKRYASGDHTRRPIPPRPPA